MSFQFYVAPRIGAGQMPTPGTWTETTGPYRSLLYSFTSAVPSARFDEIIHPARNGSLCLLEATTTQMNSVEADARILPVLPSRAADRSALLQLLITPFSSYSASWRNAAKTRLENWGVNTEWITGSHTIADVLRHVIRLFCVVQMAHNHGAEVAEFFRTHLDTQVSAIPVARRQVVTNWLTSRGIDISWITGTTTLRQIINILPANIHQIYGRIVNYKIAGMEI